MIVDDILILNRIITYIQHMHVPDTEKITLIRSIMNLSGHVTLKIENWSSNFLRIMYKFGNTNYRKRIKCEIKLRRAKQKLIF